MNGNDGMKKYFKLNNITRVIGVTNDSNEASLFTLRTTPELHMLGQFQIAYTSGSNLDNTTQEIATEDILLLKFDITSPSLTQEGPYLLVASEDEEVNSFFHFEVRGKSTRLPGLES